MLDAVAEAVVEVIVDDNVCVSAKERGKEKVADGLLDWRQCQCNARYDAANTLLFGLKADDQACVCHLREDGVDRC